MLIHKKPLDAVIKRFKKQNPIWEIFIPLFFLLLLGSPGLFFPFRDKIDCDDSGYCAYHQYNAINYETFQTDFSKYYIKNFFIEQREENSYSSKRKKYNIYKYKVALTNGKTFEVSKDIFKKLEKYVDSDENTLTYSSCRLESFGVLFLLISFPLLLLFLIVNRLYSTRIKHEKENEFLSNIIVNYFKS